MLGRSVFQIKRVRSCLPGPLQGRMERGDPYQYAEESFFTNRTRG